MKITILTLFPEMFEGPFRHSIIKRAQEQKSVTIACLNIRDFGLGRHKLVDDTPYGGGRGMVLRVDVLDKAIEYAKGGKDGKKRKVVLLDPKGTVFSQKKAQEYARLDHLVLVAGRYEGFDERVKYFVDESVSIGDYILTGGEIPAMAITDAVVRLGSDVLKADATEQESFSLQSTKQAIHALLLEYPQYTKPSVYKSHEVPPILRSGDHKSIEHWRKKTSLSYTKKHRPDLLG